MQVPKYDMEAYIICKEMEIVSNREEMATKT